MQWVAGRACGLRRKSCISICVDNAQPLSRLMQVEHARANSDHEEGLCEACAQAQPGPDEIVQQVCGKGF